MFTPEGGGAATPSLLEAGASAALFASDLLAVGGIKAVRRAGKRVPSDFSVIGFDDSPLMISTDPALTTIRQPIEATGKATGKVTVSLLMHQIEDGPELAREPLFEPELVVRASTCPAPR